MSETYFVGDLHFGHKNILNFRKDFPSIEHHNEYIINSINRTVRKTDKLFILGDAFFNKEAVELCNKINCNNIHLLLGNHDDYRVDYKALCPKIKWISGDIKYHEFWLSHIPLHKKCLHGKYNIHAHLHETKLKHKAYISVSLEQINYSPISITEIRKSLEKRKKKFLGFTW